MIANLKFVTILKQKDSSFQPMGLWFHINTTRQIYIYIYIYIWGGSKFLQTAVYIYIYMSQQRISPEGSQTDSQPKLEGQILYTVK